MLAQRDDWKPKAKPTPEPNAPAKKAVVWNNTLAFSDGTSKPLTKPPQPGMLTKRRSITNVMKGRSGSTDKMDEQIAAMNAAKGNQAGMLRVFARMYDDVESYKALVVQVDQTADDIVKLAYEKFNPNDSYVSGSYYLAIQTGEAARRRLPIDAKPLGEWLKLPDAERQKSKMYLEETKYERNAPTIAIRIYGDGGFRTVLVDRADTVALVTMNAVTKFKLTSEKPELFGLKDAIDGRDTPVAPTGYMQQYVNSWLLGNHTHRLFLVLKEVTVVVKDEPPAAEPAQESAPDGASEGTATAGDEEGGEKLTSLRVYSYGLDLDVAYRAVMVTEEEKVGAVVAAVLQRFNAPDPAENYHLEMVFQGQTVPLADDDLLMAKLRETAEKNEHVTPKLYVRQKTAAPKSAPKLASAPVASVGGSGAASSFSSAAPVATPGGGARPPMLSNAMRASSLPVLGKSGADSLAPPTSGHMPPQMTAAARAAPPATVAIAPSNPEQPGKVPEGVAADALLVSKLPMRVYCDFLPKKDSQNEFRTVMVGESTTAAQVRREAFDKFALDGDFSQTQLCVFADTLGTRVMDDTDSPLIVRNLHAENGHANVRCVLRRGGVALAGGKFPIRIHGDKVWANEAYKTVVADDHLTAADAVRLVLIKFKQGVGAKPEDFFLSMLAEDGKETQLEATDKIAAKKVAGAVYVLRRAGERRNSVVAQRLVAAEERRGSVDSGDDGKADDDEEDEDRPMAFSAAAFRNQQQSVPTANPSLMVAVGNTGGSVRLAFGKTPQKDVMSLFSEASRDQSALEAIASKPTA